jgi:hypothetical protein
MNEHVTLVDEVSSGGRVISNKFRVDGYSAVFSLDSRDNGLAIVSYTLHRDTQKMKFTLLSEFKDSIYGFLINGLKFAPENPLFQHALTRPVDPQIDDIHKSITGYFSQENATRRNIYPKVDHVAFEIRRNLDEVRVYLATGDRAPRWVLSKDLIEHEIGVFVCIEDLDNHFVEFLNSSVGMYDQSSPSSHSAGDGESNETHISASADEKLDTIIRILGRIDKRLPGGSP